VPSDANNWARPAVEGLDGLRLGKWSIRVFSGTILEGFGSTVLSR
jgi:hypothetical protein